MKNLISWVEIPVNDMDRAAAFYSKILNVNIAPFLMGDVQYGIFPSEDSKNTGALAKGEFYKPSPEGTVIYLDGGDDLKVVLDKVESAGGMIVLEKTFMSEEAGYAALFLDSEGNKMGLQSYN